MLLHEPNEISAGGFFDINWSFIFAVRVLNKCCQNANNIFKYLNNDLRRASGYNHFQINITLKVITQ